MATIAENLSLLQQTKNDIKTAIESKGQDLTSVPFTQYANKITNIGNEAQGSDNIVYSDVDNGDEISITLLQLQQVKNDIKVAIENKGQDLTNVPFTEYANKIMGIVVEEEKPGTEGLVYTGLNASGATTSTEADIVEYMIGTNNVLFSNNGYKGTSAEVYIPSTYNDKPVTRISRNAFTSNSTITKVYIPKSITTIDNRAFGKNANLTSLSVSKSNTLFKDDNGRAILSKDGTILFAYAMASGRSYTIPNGVISVYKDIFFNSTFESISIPESVELLDTSTNTPTNPFRNCESLATISVDSNNAVYKDDNGRVLLSKDGTTLFGYAEASGNSYVMPDTITKLVGYAFYRCQNLSSVILSTKLETFESYVFDGCSLLTSIEIPATVTNIGYSTFNGCSSLTEITMLPETPPTMGNTSVIPSTITTIYVPKKSLSNYKSATNWSSFSAKMVGFNLPTTGLVYTGLNSSGNIATNEEEIIAYMIGDGSYNHGNGYNGTETDVVIPKTYNGKPVTRIGQYAFREKLSITTVELPVGIIEIESFAFDSCIGLTEINLPSSLIKIGQYAFSNCTNLTSIEIPENITSLEKNAFAYCENLQNIKLNSGLLEIGEGAFTHVFANTNIIIPEGVVTIGTDAFYGNIGLTSVEIPLSVTSIGRGAFAYCQNLTEMTMLSTTPPTLVNSSAISTSTTAIYVPAESVEIYKTATNWSNFANIIMARQAQWHTVWTGSLPLSYSSPFSAGYSVKSGTAEGVIANIPTRVSGTGYKDTSTTFTNVELDYADGQDGTQVIVDDSNAQYVIAPTVDNQISAKVGRSTTGISTVARGVIITKIQQYY